MSADREVHVEERWPKRARGWHDWNTSQEEKALFYKQAAAAYVFALFMSQSFLQKK